MLHDSKQNNSWNYSYDFFNKASKKNFINKFYKNFSFTYDYSLLTFSTVKGVKIHTHV